MTLSYLLAIASFCDRKFEFIPGPETTFFSLDDIRRQFAELDRVRGGTAEFCSFVFWQLKRSGYSPIIYRVRDFNGYEFFVAAVADYYISYYDGKIYLSHECPWRFIEKSENLREWENVNRNITSTPICTN